MPLSQWNPPLSLCTLETRLISSVKCQNNTTSGSCSKCLAQSIRAVENLQLAETQTLLQVDMNLEYVKHRGPEQGPH